VDFFPEAVRKWIPNPSPAVKRMEILVSKDSLRPGGGSPGSEFIQGSESLLFQA